MVHRKNPESFDAAVDVYLSKLRSDIPSSTFRSHATAISNYQKWRSNLKHHQVSLDCQSLCEFIEHLSTKSKCRIDTICGYVCSLVNLQAYFTHRDPQVLKSLLLIRIRESDHLEYEQFRSRISKISRDSQEYAELNPFHVLFSYLRRFQFGTRTHAFVELILETNSLPSSVHLLNLEDVDLEEGTVTVKLPNTYLVTNIGLVTEKDVNLSPEALESIKEYLAYERTKSTDSGDRPLFTTSHGRASQSTLQRSVKQATKSAVNHPIVGLNSSPDEGYQLSPNDIWQYSISQLVEGQ